MSAANLASLKTKVEELKRAILKSEDSEDADSYIVQAFRVTDDGAVYCFCTDCLIGDDTAFEATLKFIDRENGEYLIIRGSASLQVSLIPPVIANQERKGSVFKIQINSAQYFQRESSSLYLFFLPSLALSRSGNCGYTLSPDKIRAPPKENYYIY
jgi:hypothetical protein